MFLVLQPFQKLNTHEPSNFHMDTNMLLLNEISGTRFSYILFNSLMHHSNPIIHTNRFPTENYRDHSYRIRKRGYIFFPKRAAKKQKSFRILAPEAVPNKKALVLLPEDSFSFRHELPEHSLAVVPTIRLFVFFALPSIPIKSWNVSIS